MATGNDRPLALNDKTEQMLLKPKRAFELLDISRSKGYALIASGELPSIRIGRAVRVPVDGLKDWVKRQTEKKDAEQN
jgi:excisionase family DNA binding protein